MKIFLHLLLIITLFSCAPSSSDKTIKNTKNYSAAFPIYLKNNYTNFKKIKAINNIDIKNNDGLNQFYKTIKYAAIWINDSLEINTKAQKFLNFLATTINYGLDTNFYHHSAISKLNIKLLNTSNIENRYKIAGEIEVLLSNNYFKLIKDLNYGILNNDSIAILTDLPRKKFTINLPLFLLKANRSDSILGYLKLAQPQQKQYKRLQKALEIFLSKHQLNNPKIKVINHKKDSLKSFRQAKLALINLNYIDATTNDSVIFLALQKFQINHGLKPDGVIGSNTAEALSKSNLDYYHQLAASLERWRWKNNWKSKNYFYVNIPAYQLQVVENNKVIETHKVVVGKPDKNTPEIDNEMKYMIIYPFWNLPYSISSQELLPKIKKDSSYLTKHGYEIFTKQHQPVNTNNIDWSKVTANNFNYKIRQNGGKTNALGLIKFIFPNKYSIYLHDTPSKRFFKNEIRAYSHGCVRLQNPLKLARYILEKDKNTYNIDSVNTFIAHKHHKQINLNHKVDVYINYFTCAVDSNNQLIFYKDIYKKDEKLIALMFHLPTKDTTSLLSAKQ